MNKVTREFKVKQIRTTTVGDMLNVIKVVNWSILFKTFDSKGEEITSKHSGETILSDPDSESFIEYNNVGNKDIEEWVIDSEGKDSFIYMLKKAALKEFELKKIKSLDVTYKEDDTEETNTKRITNNEMYRSSWSYIGLACFKMPKDYYVEVSSGLKSNLERTKSYTYITKGKLLFENVNREPRIYEKSDNKIGGGLAFVGKYKITALENSVYTCITFKEDLDMYIIKEESFKKDESITVQEIWEKALVVKGSINVDGEEVKENEFFDPIINNVIKANASSLLLFSRKRGE